MNESPRTSQAMKLPGYEESLVRILSVLEPSGSEIVLAHEALGRVLAEPLTAVNDVPDAARSAVDGFAVGSCDRNRFRLIGETAAGGRPLPALKPDEAGIVMTGALVPPNTEAVVMAERTRTEDGHVVVDGSIEPGDRINAAGSEARAGDVLAPVGTKLDAVGYAAVAGAGLDEVEVYRRPRLGLLVTGDEVRDAGGEAAVGSVVDLNGPILVAVAEALGCEITAHRRVGDDEVATRGALDDLAEGCDLIVSSGGVSKGRYDNVGRILRADAERLVLQGTAIKPGRPLHVARWTDGTPVFGMPGYPASLLVNVFLYLVPALRRLGGRSDTAVRWFDAVAADRMRCRPGRMDLVRVQLDVADGAWTARDVGSQLSSHSLNFVRAQGLARMPVEVPAGHGNGVAFLPAGERVRVLHFGLELT